MHIDSRKFPGALEGPHKEGVEWIAKNFRPAQATEKSKLPVVLIPLHVLFPAQEAWTTETTLSDHPDLFLVTTRGVCDHTLEGRVVHVVTRKGVPLLYVKEVAPSARPSRPY